MKPSKRNLATVRAAKEKLQGGPPMVSKYAAKRRSQLGTDPAKGSGATPHGVTLDKARPSHG